MLKLCSEAVFKNNEQWGQVSMLDRETDTSDAVTVVERQEASWQTFTVLFNLVNLERNIDQTYFNQSGVVL